LLPHPSHLLLPQHFPPQSFCFFEFILKQLIDDGSKQILQFLNGYGLILDELQEEISSIFIVEEGEQI
jgi:hypothetical protein